MWSRVWQYAAWTFDMPNPGDVTVYRNAGRSAIVVRQRDGSLKAFETRCLPRGRQLRGPNGRFRPLPCPYRAFTGRPDRKRRWLPATGAFLTIHCAPISLRTVAVENVIFL